MWILWVRDVDDRIMSTLFVRISASDTPGRFLSAALNLAPPEGELARLKAVTERVFPLRPRGAPPPKEEARGIQQKEPPGKTGGSSYAGIALCSSRDLSTRKYALPAAQGPLFNLSSRQTCLCFPPQALLNHASNAWFSLYSKTACGFFHRRLFVTVSFSSAGVSAPAWGCG